MALATLTHDRIRALNAENGPVELATAFIFLAIAAIAARLLLRLPGAYRPAPKWCRVWFGLFALGGVFMFLEETSYGQVFFHWDSPEWFQGHNKQQETNLHNMWGDTLSSAMRRIAEGGLPILAILLPLIVSRQPQGYRPDHFSYYTLPRWEMTGWVLAAALFKPAFKLLTPESVGEPPRDGEFKELLWAMALLVYIVVMYRRLLSADAPQPSLAPSPSAIVNG